MTQLIQILSDGISVGSTYALAALGLTLIFGILGIPHFAHGEAIMVGAFAAYGLVIAGVPFIVAVAGGTAAGAIAGLVMYIIAYKPLREAPPVALMVAALGLAIAFSQIAVVVFGTDARFAPRPLPGTLAVGSIRVQHIDLVMIATVVVVAAALTYVLQKTTFGRATRALAQDRDAALLSGVSVGRIFLITFLVGSALGGLAGALLSAANPVDPLMGTNLILKAFVVTVIGGLGSIRGAILAGWFLGIIESLATSYISTDFGPLSAYAVLVIVLAIKPHGLVRVAGSGVRV